MEPVPGASSASAELADFNWALRSHPGCVREENEDFVGAFTPLPPDERKPLFVVADGMGGHAAGEVASRLAVEQVLQNWAASSNPRPHQALRSAIRSANGAVFSASLDAETRGMGTTVVALGIVDGEAVVGHVGDSRAYLVRKGQTSQLTADHSRVGEMLRMRLITPEQAASHPARSQLTRSLGGEPAVQVDISRTALAPGDSFVLCSDGVWDLVAMREVAQAVGTGDADAAAEAIVQMALARGAHDNVTTLVVCIEPSYVAPVDGGAKQRPSFLRSIRDRFSGTGTPGVVPVDDERA